MITDSRAVKNLAGEIGGRVDIVQAQSLRDGRGFALTKSTVN
jgi:hypothetical protein